MARPDADDAAIGAVPDPMLTAIATFLGMVGVVSLGLAIWAIQPFQFNVANYTTEPFSASQGYWVSLSFVVLVHLAILAAAGVLGYRAACTKTRVSCAYPCHPAGEASAIRSGPVTVGPATPWGTGLGALSPLLLTAPLACYVFVDGTPPFALSFLLVLAGGCAALGVGVRWIATDGHQGSGWAAVVSLLVLIALLTIVHTRIQINFFEHFMFGHADIGHFTEELKNALAGRGLRCDSFDNTRLGWHFVPLLYVLVPGYALWPSPVFLMVCSGVVVHIVALPAYFLAKRLSGSVSIGWMCALAWLLLPSLSRLIYANTYGFPWPNVALPLTALVVITGVTQRWRTCCVMVGLLLLCRETTAVVVLGWGVYVAWFTERRKLGIAFGLSAIAYGALCVWVLIPHFASSGHYERLGLFGSLGRSPGDLLTSAFTQPELFFGRLMRREVGYLLLMLVVPMALLPIRGWRLAVFSLPALIPVLLLENTAWMSIKFWHHGAVLPLLFFGGIVAMRAGTAGTVTQSGLIRWISGLDTLTKPQLHRGLAASVLVAAALGHYLWGFSPVSKPYEAIVASSFLQQADPRLDTVRRLRDSIPKDRTVLATERLAAHFTDYRRLYTGRAIRPVDVVIIDRSDAWDTSGLHQAAPQFAEDPAYRLSVQKGPIVVFERREALPLRKP